MNTSTVYVEPIFVGCLIGLALALPFYGELKCFYEYLPDDLQTSGAFLGFLGVFVIGTAYVIGIPADRLLDSLMGGLEKHCRIRFALADGIPKDETTEKDKSNWEKILAGEDPFPEDRYRTKALLYAGSAFNDWLQYIRTRVRMSRALAFTIPSLTFAGLACLALKDSQSLTGQSAWWLKGGVPLAWFFAMLFVILLKCCASESGSKPNSSRIRYWRPRGRWHPPRTDKSCYIRNYVCDRRSVLSALPPTSVAGLFLDLALQPFPISSVLLLVAAAIAGCHTNLGHAGLIPAGLGVLLTCAVSYAWWRSTETFMTYLLIAGRELDRSVSQAGRAT